MKMKMATSDSEKTNQTNGYLNAIETSEAYHNLDNDSSQLIAKHNLIEAISGIRGTLPPLKQIGQDFGSGFKWSGGCRSPDGRIFFAPHGADHILCINPFDGTISTYGDPVSSFNINLNLVNLQNVANINAVPTRKYSDVVVGPLGLYLYLIPASSRYVLKMEIKTGKWEALDGDLGSLDWKWGKGVLCGHLIFCSPHNSNRILMIDCNKHCTRMIGDDYGGQAAKWGTPVMVPLGDVKDKSLSPEESVIVFPPLNANRILVLNPRTKKTYLVGDDFTDALFKYDGACLGSDGAVYCAPSCATQFLRIEVLANIDSNVVERDEVYRKKKNKANQILGKRNTSSMSSSGDNDEVETIFRADDVNTNKGGGGGDNWKTSIDRMTKVCSLDLIPHHKHHSENNKHRKTILEKVHKVFHHTKKVELKKPEDYGVTSEEYDDGFIDDEEPAVLLVQSTQDGSLHDVLQDTHKETQLPPVSASNLSPVSSPPISPASPPSSPLSQIPNQKVISSKSYKWPPEIRCSFHGIERAGNFKFGDMALSADGKLGIAIPLCATAFYVIDTCSEEKSVRRMGPKLFTTNLKFGAGVIGLDGYLYCSPLEANQALRLDTLALSHYAQKGKQKQKNGKSMDGVEQSENDENDDRSDINEGKHEEHKSSNGEAIRTWNKTTDSLFRMYVHKRQFESSAQFTPTQTFSKAKLNFRSIVNKVKEENVKSTLSRHKEEKNEDEDEEKDDDMRKSTDREVNHTNNHLEFSTKSILIAIAAYAHWRKFASIRARERQGFSASDRTIGNRDKLMRSYLLHEPEVWCFGLTLEDSTIPEDLCDWLATFADTEAGHDFIATCGRDAHVDKVVKVSKLPNLVYSLITLAKRDLLMELPIIRKAILKHYAFQGDWFVKCLCDRQLMEKAVDFVELASEDIHSQHMNEVQLLLNKKDKANSALRSSKGDNDVDSDSDSDEEDYQIYKNKSFEAIAAIDNFVAPMLRLPVHLQDRIVSTQLMGAVLDELFTERPLALLIMKFDFFFIIALIFLLMNATWSVQHDGDLRFNEILVIIALLFFNFIYVIREYINYRSAKGIKIRFSKVLDIFNVITLFAVVGMSFSKIRLTPIFLVVAATTSGTCWLKLLNFMSIIHLKFAVYIEAIKLITKALRFIMLTLLIFMAMFANMFFVVMKSTGYDDTDDTRRLRTAGADDDGDAQSIYSKTFTHIQTSFLTLFRMLLGDFEMDWFIRDGEALLTFYSVILFLLYMIGVFVILFNVLIAVVCDNYSIALSEAHAIFLRSRLQVVANLDMQGLTKLRNGTHLKNNDNLGDGVAANRDRDFGFGTGNAYYNGYDNRNTAAGALEIFPGVFHNSLEMFQYNSPSNQTSIPTSTPTNSKPSSSIVEFFERLADRVDYFLKDSVWHKYMRSLLSIGSDIDFHESIGKSQARSEEDSDSDDNANAVSMIKKLDKRILLLEELELASEDRIMQHVQTVVNGMEARIAALCTELINNNGNVRGDGSSGGGPGGKSNVVGDGRDNHGEEGGGRRGVPPPPASLVQAHPPFRLRGPFFDCSI